MSIVRIGRRQRGAQLIVGGGRARRDTCCGLDNLPPQLTDGGGVHSGKNRRPRGKGWRQVGAARVVLDEGLHSLWTKSDLNRRPAVESQHHGLEIVQNDQGLSGTLHGTKAFQASYHHDVLGAVTGCALPIFKLRR